MRNDINATTTNDILARAIKARDRRDRDGKKRRPVTDGLIEYAVKINKDLADALEVNAAYAAKIADLEREIANERAKLAEIAEKVA